VQVLYTSEEHLIKVADESTRWPMSKPLTNFPCVQVLYTSEEHLIKVAGVDAAMYIKVLRMGESPDYE
jgi:hypothetical protein